MWREVPQIGSKMTTVLRQLPEEEPHVRMQIDFKHMDPCP